MIVDACKTVKTWRQDVKLAAMAVMPAELYDGCLRFDATFYMPRPKGHYGTGKNAHVLKNSSRPAPCTTPDLLKLGRSTEDALTGIIWVDDARVVDERLRKLYAGRGEPVGAELAVYAMADKGPPAAALTPDQLRDAAMLREGGKPLTGPAADVPIGGKE